MRAARVLDMLLVLQRRGRLTARELGAALEVSERTILRDVEALSEAGVPIFASRGSGLGVTYGSLGVMKLERVWNPICTPALPPFWTHVRRPSSPLGKSPGLSLKWPQVSKGEGSCGTTTRLPGATLPSSSAGRW